MDAADEGVVGLGVPAAAVVVVEHRDRVAPFGVEHVEAALSATGRRLVVLDDTETTDDLVRDMTRAHAGGDSSSRPCPVSSARLTSPGRRSSQYRPVGSDPDSAAFRDMIKGGHVDVKDINRKVIEQFRAGGDIEGMHRDRLVLLTTVGARTGKRHTTPMMFHRDGGRLLVIASNMGAVNHPDWYLNLVANPLVTVEVGDDTYDAVAIPTEGEERERPWTTLKESYPFLADHEAKTARTIPVVALIRA